MKLVLIYQEQGKEIAIQIEELSKKLDFDFLSFNATEKPLKHCIGCFECWTKTPGVCIQKNSDSTEFLKAIYKSDIILYVSKITFGGFSSEIKNYVDRFLPISHPDFVIKNGEMHHKPRYNKFPTICAVGFDAKSKDSEETFIKYTKANLKNCSSVGNNFCNSIIYKNNNELETWLKNLKNFF